jgi:hypothetical protein
MDYTKELERIAKDAAARAQAARNQPEADNLDAEFGESTAPTHSPGTTGPLSENDARPAGELLKADAAATIAQTASDITPTGAAAAAADSARFGRYLGGGVFGLISLDFLFSGLSFAYHQVGPEGDRFQLVMALLGVWVSGIALSTAVVFAAPEMSRMHTVARRVRMVWVILGVLAAVTGIGGLLMRPR